MPASNRKLVNFLRRLSEYSGLTMRPAVGVLVGFFTGRYLDAHWETEPLLAVAGVLVGLALGLFTLYREAVKAVKKAEKPKK